MYIYKAGVVGAGAMGAEIAQVVTYAGLPVVLKDVNQELVSKGWTASVPFTSAAWTRAK